MFVKTTILKKLMKDAWKTCGIYVGCDGERIIIRGGYWQISADKEVMRKTDLAAIVELTGELPEEGKAVIAAEKRENKETECDSGNIKTADSAAGNGGRYYVTRMIYVMGEKAARVLQDPNTKACVLLNEDIIRLIDKKCIDEQLEDYPDGPIAVGRDGHFMAWTNSKMDLMAGRIIPPEQNKIGPYNLLELLGTAKLERAEV